MYFRQSKLYLSNQFWIVSLIILIVIFIFNLPYLFVDLLDHDDGLWYYYASEGVEIYKFKYRGRIAFLGPYRDWLYSNGMVYLGLPMTRALFVLIMGAISILLYKLYYSVLGINKNIAFFASVIPNVLPSLIGIPVGLNASYAMWGLLPVLGSMLLISESFTNKGIRSFVSFVIAFILYFVGLNLIESTNFLIPSVLLLFIIYFRNDKVKSFSYIIPFICIGLWQFYKQYLYTHLEPTIIPKEVVFNRMIQFFNMSSLFQLGQPYSFFLVLSLSVIGVASIAILGHKVLNKPTQLNCSNRLYRFFVIIWAASWFLSNSYAYVFKSPVFRAYDYAYISNFGLVLLQVIGITTLINTSISFISGKRIKDFITLSLLFLIFLVVGYQRINSCYYRFSDSFRIMRRSLLTHEIPEGSQLIILNIDNIHNGQILANSGHIRYILNRNDIYAVIGPEKSFNNIYSPYHKWTDRWVGFDPGKPVIAFYRSGEYLDRMELMLQVLSTDNPGSARLTWSLYDIINFEMPVVIASGIGMASYFHYLQNGLPSSFQKPFVAFAPNEGFDYFIDKDIAFELDNIEGLIHDEKRIDDLFVLKNVFLSQLNNQTHLQLLINVLDIPSYPFNLSYALDGKNYLVYSWDFITKDDNLLITTPAVDTIRLKEGIRLRFANTGTRPNKTLIVKNGELDSKQDILLKISALDLNDMNLSKDSYLKSNFIDEERWFSIRNMELFGNLEYFNNRLAWSVYYSGANELNNLVAMGIGWDAFEDFHKSIKTELHSKKTRIVLAGQENENDRYIFSYNIIGDDYRITTKKSPPSERWLLTSFMGFDRSYIEPVNHFGYNEWTFSVWIKPSVPIPGAAPFYSHYAILEGEDGVGFLGLNNYGGLTKYTTLISRFSFNQPEWNYISYRYKEGELSAFVNGENAGSITTDNPLSTVKRRRIAQRGDSAHQYVGQLMNVLLWNRALTQSEIQETMFMKLNGKEPGLVGYWPLDSIFIENGVKKTPDLSPSKNHGILVGDPVLYKSSDSLYMRNY